MPGEVGVFRFQAPSQPRSPFGAMNQACAFLVLQSRVSARAERATVTTKLLLPLQPAGACPGCPLGNIKVDVWKRPPL